MKDFLRFFVAFLGVFLFLVPVFSRIRVFLIMGGRLKTRQSTDSADRCREMLEESEDLRKVWGSLKYYVKKG